MNDLRSLIAQARSQLTVGLAALRAPGVPREITDTSAPVAHAVALLDQLAVSPNERLRELGSALLSTIQRALHQLQWTRLRHPALDRAIDCVAAALAVVFTLNEMTTKAPPGPSADLRSGVAPSPAVAPSLGHAPQAVHQVPAVSAAAPHAPTAGPVTLPRPQLASDDSSTSKHDSFGSAGTEAVGLLRVEAELGAHSATNFYRGFRGDDVIEHGGLFVATYNAPDVGQRVGIRVAMPGGHEFLAEGIVRWRRLAPPNASLAPEVPPGFGVQFVDVPSVGKELIRRYVSNREPLFHDDD